jgi:hypothetical protein
MTRASTRERSDIVGFVIVAQVTDVADDVARLRREMGES